MSHSTKIAGLALIVVALLLGALYLLMWPHEQVPEATPFIILPWERQNEDPAMIAQQQIWAMHDSLEKNTQQLNQKRLESDIRTLQMEQSQLQMQLQLQQMKPP